jgi:hypothetical protein
VKKPKKSGGKQKPVPLKKWSKPELVREDWDFTAVSQTVDETGLFYVYMWEMDRELGSGTEPFALSPRARKSLPRFTSGTRGVLEVPRSEIEGISELLEKSAPTFQTLQTLHAFLIDWSRTERATVDAFRAWLRDESRHPGRKCADPKQGKPSDLRASLWKIGAYRLSMAGYPPKEALAKLGKMTMSVQNLAAARRGVNSLLKNMEIADRERSQGSIQEMFG